MNSLHYATSAKPKPKERSKEVGGPEIAQDGIPREKPFSTNILASRFMGLTRFSLHDFILQIKRAGPTSSEDKS
jgi:hypothetical protein